MFESQSSVEPPRPPDSPFQNDEEAVFYEDNKQIAESDDHFDILEKVDEDDVHGKSRRAKLVDHHLVDQQNKVTSS